MYSSSEEKEEFYIFGVGQGNSQLAIYNYSDHKFGVLYDCGSSSAQLHPKFQALQSIEGSRYKNFLLRKDDKGKDDKGKDDKGKDDIRKDDNKTPSFTSPNTKNVLLSNFSTPHSFQGDLKVNTLFEFNFTTPTSHQYDTTQLNDKKQVSTLKSVPDRKVKNVIYNTINHHNLTELFIFLSHPDEDHINYINNETIPERNTLNLTVFLGGDWLGDGGGNSKKDNLTEDVIKTLRFLINRDNTTIDLPFYWEYTNNDKNIYNSIKEKLKKIKEDELCNEFKKIKKNDKYSTLKNNDKKALVNIIKNLDKEDLISNILELEKEKSERKLKNLDEKVLISKILELEKEKSERKLKNLDKEDLINKSLELDIEKSKRKLKNLDKEDLISKILELEKEKSKRKLKNLDKEDLINKSLELDIEKSNDLDKEDLINKILDLEIRKDFKVLQLDKKNFEKEIKKIAEEITRELLYNEFKMYPKFSYENKVKPFNGNLNLLLNKANLKEKQNDLYNNVNIYISNFPFKDINNQSIIVSLTMPKLKMKFVCTGDAHNETFELMSLVQDVQNQPETLLTLLMLPHHGSIENFSKTLFQIFKPDILAISAGNGAKYVHPSSTLIDLCTDFAIKVNKGKLRFKDSFEIRINSFFLSFIEKGKGVLRTYDDNEKFPIICTNIQGTIKVDEKGFHSSFLNLLNIENDKYEIDFLHCVDKGDVKNKQKMAVYRGVCYLYNKGEKGTFELTKFIFGSNRSENLSSLDLDEEEFMKNATKLTYSRDSKSLYYPVKTDKNTYYYLVSKV